MMNSLKKFQVMTVITALFFTAGLLCADDSGPMTVEAMYPDLASGALVYARPAAMPDGVLLKANGVEIKLSDIEKAIAQQPPHVRTTLEKNAFYVLEQEAAGKLLVQVARKTLDGRDRDLDDMSDDRLINALFDQLTKEVTATEDEQQAFYRDNPHYFHGAPFDRVQPQIAQYMAQQKKQQFVEEYIKTIGRQMTIEVSDGWVKTQAAAAQDNPLDKARQSGIPTVAMFYAASPCCPDTTGPILADIGRQFGDRLNIVSLNPNTEWILAARFRVRNNPTLVFYDAKGKETMRRQKAMDRDEIAAALTEWGLE